MKLEKVSIEDIYPNEKNPRNDFGDIQGLADTFSMNEDAPGEPFNAPVVVRDGDIYRIVDGERRYRAMKKAGTTSCHVHVCENMDEANTAVAMIATDDKQQLSELERSRGVQQMLLLGVDPVKVERAAKMKKGTARAAKKAMEAAGEAAEEMTLDRLFAIAELEKEEDIDELSNCSEKEWQSVLATIEKKNSSEKIAAEYREILESAGIPIVDDHEGLHYLQSHYNKGTLQTFVNGLDSVDGLSAVIDTSVWSTNATIYSVRETAVTHNEAEEEEREREVDEAVAKMAHGEERRAKWYASKIRDNEYNPLGRNASSDHTDEYLLHAFFDDANSWHSNIDKAKSFCQMAGLEMSDLSVDAIQGRLAAFMYEDNNGELSPFRGNIVAGHEAISYDAALECCADYIRWIDAVVADGYVMDEIDQEVYDAVVAAIDACEIKEKEDEDVN